MNVNPIGVDVSIYSSDLQTLEDEEGLYGNGVSEAPVDRSSGTSLAFTVCDSITNIGPISDCLVSDPTYLASEVQEYQQKKNLEFVTISGHGKNGAMCVLQVEFIGKLFAKYIKEAIIPELIRAFELPNCSAGWTLFDSRATDDMHSYLVISREQGTMVMNYFVFF
jgi:cleavage and polyadenylation specificity factor subunit 1